MNTLGSAFSTAAERLLCLTDKDFLLFVLRHGESQGQKNQDLYKELGDERIPLTPTGYKQSRNAGITISSLLDPASPQQPVIVTSTGERSLATGASILHVMIRRGFTAAFIPDRRLDKQRFGKFDGLFTNKERQKCWPEEYGLYNAQERNDGAFFARPPDGESIADVQDRLEDFLKSLPYDGCPRIIVTHGTNTLCIDNVLMNYGEEWVLSNQDLRANCAIRMISGNFNDGFSVLDIEDNPQNLDKNFQPSLTIG